MLEMTEVPTVNFDPAQAAELARLVELEARWENLRTSPARTPQVVSTPQDLPRRQKAYEAFRAKLAAYNKRYRPAHIPELLLNTPVRLGKWCRAMRDLYLQVEQVPDMSLPAQLLEKAYRWADRVAGTLGKDCITRTGSLDSIRDAIQGLELLGQWCEDLARAA